jgi:uncharacterized membrane protein YqaE (UPF0057 family)
MVSLNRGLHQLCRDLLSNPVIEDYHVLEGESGNNRKGKDERRAEDEESLMKALRYFFCVVIPPLAVLLTGRIASFFLSLILTLLGWISGVIMRVLS